MFNRPEFYKPAELAALRPKSEVLNAVVLEMERRLFPRGFDLSPNPPDTLGELTSIFHNTGRLIVSNSHADDTIFARRHVNHAFRAWHDLTHVTGQYEFTVPGEIGVVNAQLDQVRGIVGAGSPDMPYLSQLVYAQVLGQIAYADSHGGQFPAHPRAEIDAYFAHPESVLDPEVRF